MRHDVNGVVEHDGEHYTYSATVHTGNDAHTYGDEVAAIEPYGDKYSLDEFVADDELWEVVAERCKVDARERIHHPDLRDEETLDDGLARLAKLYHPEELVKIQITTEDTLGSLIDKLNLFTAEHALQPMCAREQLLEQIDADASKYVIAWLEAFVRRWDQLEEKEAP
jgi:hypothetical protein